MITVITGTPGAGKTLHGIEKLVLPVIGTTVKQRVGDEVLEHPRTVYTNINGFLCEHELIEAGATWEMNKEKEWVQVEGGNTKGLHNWHQWAKPGSLIVFDEFQKAWPPRPNGAAVPPDVQALDTHRHLGVDFVLICQNVNNVDRHVHGLVGRHLHIRRVANLPAAIVYEWDHCSRSLLYRNAVARKPWRYSRRVYKVYRSAELHTKQPRSLPLAVFIVPIAFAGLFYMVPKAYGNLTAPLRPKVPTKAPAAAPAAPKPVPAAPAPVPPVGVPGAPAPVPPSEFQLTPTKSVPWGAGCAKLRHVCKCFDEQGNPHEVEPGVCLARIEPAVPPLAAADPFFDGSRPLGHSDQAELELLAAVAKSAGRSSRLPGQ